MLKYSDPIFQSLQNQPFGDVNEKINEFQVENTYHFLFQTTQTRENAIQKDYYFAQKQENNSLTFFRFQELKTEGIEDFRRDAILEEHVKKQTFAKTHTIRFADTDELCIQFHERIGYDASVDITKEDISLGWMQGICFVGLKEYAKEISLQELLQTKDENSQYITKTELWEVISDKIKELPKGFVAEFRQMDEHKTQNLDKALDYFAYLEQHKSTRLNLTVVAETEQKLTDPNFKEALEIEFKNLTDLNREFVRDFHGHGWKDGDAETLVKAYNTLSYQLQQFQVSNNHSRDDFERFFSKLDRIGLLEKVESIEICFETRGEGGFGRNLEKFESKFPKLTQVCLMGNKNVPVISSDIPRLQSLEDLTIRHSYREMEPLDFHEYPKLRTLALNEVPSDLKLVNTQEAKLQELYWTESNLSKVPEEIFNFKDLTVLSLRQNNIAYIPSQMSDVSLHLLNLEGNRIKVAENIPTHTLDKLYLNNNSVENLSKGMIEFIALNKSTTLDLSNNNTEKLQQNISIADWIKMHVAQLGKIFGFSEGQVLQLFEKKEQEKALWKNL